MKNDDPITLDFWHEDEEREFDDGQIKRRFAKEWPELFGLLEEKEMAIKKHEEFFNSVSCLLVEGVEFMTKTQIYDAIKRDWEECMRKK